ncbi:Polyketide cyclase / dehydrase and lipid transport [Botrimarina colliarenosi]|uniref:Polyketide cyclase / dehydrase and lipid transport n=1 Tax=Botrimarina colliarenosi TaxID=2528001 RepID=A0A5C6AKP2_9BACT|nr:SRPBCC family protein [Botrimarina colliarenosi]TWU00593.1 Polyketide cyclase / dehydrase and lipid transport [Botrimarina colliarenosi]
MACLTVTESIDAPPERVFALATDFAGAPERVRGVKRLELLTDGPIGVGTRWRETRQIFGKESTEELEITRFDPPRSYTAECETCGCRFESTITCEPEGAGTLVTFQNQTQALTLSAKLMAPLGVLMAGGMKKLFAADLADLRRAAEA